MGSCNTLARPVDSQRESTPTSNGTDRAARKYGEGGIPVGPCKHWPVKKPHFIKGILEHGFNDFTTDTATIDAFWDMFPEASIGMRLGEWHLRFQRGGIRVVCVIAVDIESKKSHGVDGFTGLKELEMKLGPLPHTWSN